MALSRNASLTISLLLFLLISFFQPSFQQPLCHEFERLALLQFKNSFFIEKNASNDPLAYPKTNLWKSQGIDCCFWEGISCDQHTGRVVRMDLESSCLFGSINFSSSLFRLDDLQYLNLADNDFNSSEIPFAFGNLSSLTYLNLSHCGMFGKFPNAIFELSKLENLYVHDNWELTGTLPEFHFSNLLKELDVSNTNLSGEFPKSLGHLSSLEYLDVANCNFSGVLPSSLSNLTNLQYFKLRNNSFQGSMAPFFSNLTQLDHVDLSANDFTFTKIPSLARSKNLRFLDLSFNFLKGSLPIPSPSIFYYSAASNSFDGEIPHEFCNMTYLELLDLSHNNLSGIVPQCLGNHSKSLSNLSLRHNKLKGKLPRSLSNCKNLEFLDLSYNQFRDTFPSWLGVFLHLKVIMLRSNGFYGAIDDSEFESYFPELRIVDLSHNEFQGTLPLKYFWRWNIMSYLDKSTARPYYLTSIGLSITITNKGKEMKYEKILSIFTAIDLSCNKFSGAIPEVVVNLRRLELLNLSSNNLVGPIPPDLGYLLNLEALDLSNNRLTGTIPPELTQLNFLEVFSVSHNLLTGLIPQGHQFATFENSTFQGNPGLCGKPLSKKCGRPPPPSSSSEENRHTSLLEEIGWKAVLIGWGFGFLGGVVLGIKVFATNQEWLMETFLFIQGRQKRGVRRSIR